MRALLTSLAILGVVFAQPLTPEYKRGDEVRVRTDQGRPASPPVQRVMAVPGDRVKIDGKRLVVNGQPLFNISPKLLLACGSWDQAVPSGHYFLVGEEVKGDSASRSCSLLPASHISGAAQR